jgi:hypothetical protein
MPSVARNSSSTRSARLRMPVDVPGDLDLEVREQRRTELGVLAEALLSLEQLAQWLGAQDVAVGVFDDEADAAHGRSERVVDAVACREDVAGRFGAG